MPSTGRAKALLSPFHRWCEGIIGVATAVQKRVTFPVLSYVAGRSEERATQTVTAISTELAQSTL
jgi:hypothetical protein